jgi:hypothetical protein
MKRIFTFFPVAALFFALAPIGLAQKGKPPRTQDIPLRVRFAYCAPADAACIAQNRVRNDFDLDYVNGSEGVAAVFNIVSGTNDLTINLLTTSTRRAVIDLLDLTTESSGQAIPSWRTTPQYAKWFFNVRHAYLAKTSCGIPPCDMTTVMASSGNVSGDSTNYYLQWNPDSVQPINSPETTSMVNVHYDVINGVDVWTVTPLPNGAGRILGGFARELKGSHPGNSSNVAAGQYLVPFTLTARPQ